MSTTRALRGKELALLTIACVFILSLAEVTSRALHLSKTWSSYIASGQLNLAQTMTPQAVGFTRPPHRSWPMPYGKTFASNAEGFRDQEFANVKAPETIRIAFLGDSVTEGFGVETNERFSDVTVRELKASGCSKCEGMNFGVAGHSTADELLVLKDHVFKVAPDIIVLQVGWNDFVYNLKSLDIVDGSRPNVRAPEPPPPPPHGFKELLQRHSSFYLAIAERVAVLRLRRGVSTSVLDNVESTTPAAWAATGELLGRIFDQCRAANVKVAVAYFPMDVEVQVADEERAGRIRGKIAGLCRRDPTVTVIDILSVLRHHKDTSLYLDDVHLTAKGHRLAAETIAKAVSRMIAISARAPSTTSR